MIEWKQHKRGDTGRNTRNGKHDERYDRALTASRVDASLLHGRRERVQIHLDRLGTVVGFQDSCGHYI